ncbi:hypothetical protein ERO13_A06G080666v2 [Gossypium hirsutum]|uniref:Uncharacterized protein n=2 Tax=Gossypium TaxID=3633 RepID=A0A5J5VCN9_GOSBA|nr:hypothetical protein ES319_A06G088200v1 [Gossypium barbadense]KAG4194934.1 hypothetical protein ERO13_A06G080666v2 [Gossypium hirsutum]TYJ29746.1 hypothetical protein E1A91_A06G087900v1 [Gossypium mustelinum]
MNIAKKKHQKPNKLKPRRGRKKRFPKIQNLAAAIFLGNSNHEETNTHYWDSKPGNKSLM